MRIQRAIYFEAASMPILISPPVCRILPEIARILVVLPAPFEPISVTKGTRAHCLHSGAALRPWPLPTVRLVPTVSRVFLFVPGRAHTRMKAHSRL